MQVTVSIKTIEQKFPGGTVGGDWRIEMALANDPGTVVFSYEGVNHTTNFDLPDSEPPETYVVRGTRLDAGGTVIGPIVTTQYTVGEDLVPLDVAQSISVTSSAPARTAAAKPRR